MQQAIFLAQKAFHEGVEVPVAAVVLYEGNIIAQATNTREKDHNPLGHAELNALTKASQHLQSWRLSDCLLLVTLEPCLMCLAAAYQARIAELIYGASDPKGGALSLGYALHQDARLNHRFEVKLQPHPVCGQLLSDFFKQKR